ncbi:hypothetical protein LTR60_001433 [Cryomyces antarcticus]|nr:hypothetical protein LTR60_001433 [Cryomyces antarcticus]
MIASQLIFALSFVPFLATAAPVSVPVSSEELHVLSRRGFGYNGVTTATSTAWYTDNFSKGPSTPASGYQCYHGDVSKYPTKDKWMNFYDLFNHNKPAMLARNNGNGELVGEIWNAIVKVSQDAKVDARVILATVMQESTGQANVPCTGTMPNCGLMQASYGSISFNPADSQGSITEMIREGVQGTNSGGPYGGGGPGLVQFLNNVLSWVTNPWPGNPYAAARMYNSGHISNNNLDDLTGSEWSTKSYANDIANRLLGWDGSGAGFAAC